jgi:hypothetical protein
LRKEVLLVVGSETESGKLASDVSTKEMAMATAVGLRELRKQRVDLNAVTWLCVVKRKQKTPPPIFHRSRAGISIDVTE